jgi:hypothetical protein
MRTKMSRISNTAARNSSFTGAPENQARLWHLTADMLGVQEYGSE